MQPQRRLLRQLSIICVFSLALSLPGWSSPAEAAPNQQDDILSAADKQLELLLPLLAEHEGAYLDRYGMFGQLQISGAIPADGALLKPAPDAVAAPSDVYVSWPKAEAAPAALDAAQSLGEALAVEWPASIEVQVYDGPSGKGYVVLGYVVVKGTTWARAINRGPETWREQKWQPLPEATE